MSPAPARSIGRYLVIEELPPVAGARVLLALDPELMRRLTIELYEGGGDDARARLRDAQAVGRLRHPGVLAVHDAGSCAAGLYVAQEYAPGGTLEHWLEQQRAARNGSRGSAASLRRLLAPFLLIGEALACAHAAGLVHGRFSAGCVLMGSDGAPRLVGLRLLPEEQRARAEQQDSRDFCAALRTALGEQRAPHRLRRLLSAGRGAEEPSLAAVLSALRAPHRAVRGLWGLGLPLLLLAGILLAWSRYRAEVCGGAERQLGELLGERQRAAIGENLRRTGRGESLPDLDALVERFRSRWLAEYHEACADTRLRDGQPEESMELRLGCLQEHAAELHTALGILQSGEGALDARAVEHALDTVRAATELTGCRDVPVLRSRYPLPRDPGQRARAMALRSELAVVQVLHDASRYREASERVEQALVHARAAGFAPMVAEALYHKGRVLRMGGAAAAAEAAYVEAVGLAEAGRHDSLVASLFISLVYIVGVQQGRFAQGLELARYANAALRRCTACDSLWNPWRRQLGTLLLVSGDPAAALADYQQIPDEEAAAAPGHLDLENNRGLAYLGLGRLSEARDRFERSLRLRTAQFGPAHPSLLAVLGNLGEVAGRQGRCDERMRLAEQQLELCRRSLEPEHPQHGSALLSHGRALAQRGRLREAEREVRAGLQILERAYGAQHPDRVQGLAALAQIFSRSARPGEASAVLRDARALLDQLGHRAPDAELQPLLNMPACRDTPAVAAGSQRGR